MAQTPNEFKGLKIVHSALVTGLTLMSVIVLVLYQTEAISPDEEYAGSDRIFQIIAVVLSLASLLSGFSIFRKRVAAIRNIPESGAKKMEQYRAACIMWWALIEGPGIFCVLSYFLIGNYAFLALALFHAALLFVFMPRKDNIVLLLNLTSEDVMKLEGRM